MSGKERYPHIFDREIEFRNWITNKIEYCRVNALTLINGMRAVKVTSTKGKTLTLLCYTNLSKCNNDKDAYLYSKCMSLKGCYFMQPGISIEDANKVADVMLDNKWDYETMPIQVAAIEYDGKYIYTPIDNIRIYGAKKAYGNHKFIYSFEIDDIVNLSKEGIKKMFGIQDDDFLSVNGLNYGGLRVDNFNFYIPSYKEEETYESYGIRQFAGIDGILLDKDTLTSLQLISQINQCYVLMNEESRTCYQKAMSSRDHYLAAVYGIARLIVAKRDKLSDCHESFQKSSNY